VQVSDFTRRSAQVTTGVPTPDPEARYQGCDGSDLVQVEVDGAARHVAVALESGWRRTIGGPALGAAILAAYTAATTARLTAWAEQAAERRDTGDVGNAPAPAMVDRQVPWPRATPEMVQSLSRAFCDLREFGLRLTELHAATTTTASPGRIVVVTARAAQITGIELAPDWLRTAGDADIERVTGQTLRAALDDLARLPERALEGCPDLQAVLADHPSPIGLVGPALGTPPTPGPAQRQARPGSAAPPPGPGWWPMPRRPPNTTRWEDPR
jgi:hypothetical protein